jgi:2-oxoglutarate ferredoxin oxidoreductase subunit beta
VQFNNHTGSTKGYDFVREHNEAVNRLDMIAPRETISVDYEPGSTVTVTQHDGSVLKLHKLAGTYDPTDRIQSMAFQQARQAAGEIATGLLYIDPSARDLHEGLDTVDTPLNALSDAQLVPGAAALERLNASLR